MKNFIYIVIIGTILSLITTCACNCQTKTIDHVEHGVLFTTWYSVDGYHTVFPKDSKTMASKGDTAWCIWSKN